MSFIGIVTRKEQDTGVTLEAKIVTPNKKKATKQKFKVKVKKSGLSDYECCVIDQATIRNKLESQQDLMAIKDDMNFTYNGENGTKIEYSIENIGEPKLTDYLADDGKLISRPKYGENDAEGYIAITVSKGEEHLPTKIRVSIKQMLGQEVLSSASIKEASLWNAIKGKNAAWTNDNSSGHKNIFYNLNLINNTNQVLVSDKTAISALTNTPVSITWDIIDNATNSVITQSRVDNETGAIFMPSYKDACTLLGTAVNAELIGTSQFDKRIRIGDLIIKATFTLGEDSRTITFDCSTCSKYITNKEVVDFAQKKVDIVLDNSMNNKPPLSYRELTDSSFETITIPASATGSQLYIGLACSTTAKESYEINELNLKQGQVDYVFTHQLCEFRKANAYDDTDGVFSSTSITNQTREDTTHFGTSTRLPLIIDVDKLKALSSSDKKSFTIKTTVSALRYTKDGTSEELGSGEVAVLYCHIKLNDSLV